MGKRLVFALLLVTIAIGCTLKKQSKKVRKTIHAREINGQAKQVYKQEGNINGTHGQEERTKRDIESEFRQEKNSSNLIPKNSECGQREFLSVFLISCLPFLVLTIAFIVVPYVLFNLRKILSY